MANIYSTTFKCPICDTNFEDYIPTTNGEFIYYESDLRPCTLGIDPIPYQVHTCPVCFYSAYEFQRSTETKLRRYIFSNNFLCGIDLSTLLPFTKYHLLAKIMEFNGANQFEIGFAYIKANWMARKCNIPSMENFYQVKALVRFEDLYQNGNYQPAKKSVIVYILGELTRRLKYFDKASEYFARIKSDRIYSMYAQQIMLLVQRSNSEITILNK